MSKRTGERVIEGSGNVFADLGFANPELERLKSGLVQQIATVIERRGLTQVGAAETLGIDQPKISALLRGRFGGYSTDRLLRFLNALDQDIELIIKDKPRSRREATMSVTTKAAA